MFSLRQLIHFAKREDGEPIEKEIVFVGTHVYDSRVVKDGYSEDDLIALIRSACSEQCEYKPTQKMTVLQHPVKRASGYGCMVRDELTLECSVRHPKSEVFSVVRREILITNQQN